MLMGMNMDREKRALLESWRRLGVEQRNTLLRFARFLEQESGAGAGEEAAPEIPDTPLSIPRPEGESAVAGLKRLKKSYPMIEADERVLAEASQILMGKVMGVPDAEVIDRLEVFFASCYQVWLSKRSAEF
ncbi:MAG: Crp/Fnr family transcriptional regulator [Magnetococcales bacterium]|nr:Crp/Fnr family transcriptional regulator [Magnetococcales bacterium]